MEVINNPRKKVFPGATDAYGEAWNIMWKVFVPLLVVSIIGGIISGPTASINLNGDEDFSDVFRWFMVPLGMFALAYGIFVAGPIGYSVNWVFLKAAREEKFEIRDMFAVFQKNYWNAVAANVVVGIIVGLGFVMLIVPGIIFACRLAFVSYLVIDRDMELTEALNKSWEMTRGYGWQIFAMGIIAFFVAVLGLMALFVGIFVSLVWIQLAFATMYQAVVDHDGHFGAGNEVSVDDLYPQQ